jgi:hypothetical protein
MEIIKKEKKGLAETYQDRKYREREQEQRGCMDAERDLRLGIHTPNPYNHKTQRWAHWRWQSGYNERIMEETKTLNGLGD